jgi:hypothetical protein
MNTPTQEEHTIPIPPEADVAQWLETYAAWYRALGTNFRERERVKRLIDRWVTRLAAKPKVERQALLAALVQAEAMNETNKTEEAISSELTSSPWLKPGDSWEHHPQGFKVAVLGVDPDASGTVPASRPRHLAHLKKP